MAVSIRHGKFAPSMRFKPEMSFKNAETNWRAGIDPPEYTTTMQHGNKDIHHNAPTRFEATRSTKTKNDSDKDAIQGSYRYVPNEHFKSVAQNELTKTTLTEGYSKRKPADGFDRLTANRTNYSLGNHKFDYKSSTHGLQMSHPEDRSHRPSQPQVGGWNRKNGHYHQDIESMRTVKRGGGGAGGVLQMNFDIISGQDKPNVRSDNMKRFGPRVSENIREKRSDGGVDSYGQLPQQANIISGKLNPKPRAPPRQTEASLRREDKPVVRTRPW